MENNELSKYVDLLYTSISHDEDDEHLEKQVIKNWLLSLPGNLSNIPPQKLIERFKIDCVCTGCNKLEELCDC